MSTSSSPLKASYASSTKSPGKPHGSLIYSQSKVYEEKRQTAKKQRSVKSDQIPFQPQVNCPSTLQSSKQVTDRLTQAGRQYKRKLEEKRLLAIKQKRDSINQIMQSPRKPRPTDTARHTTAAFRQKRNLEQKTRERDSEQARLTHTPTLWSQSEKILKNSQYVGRKVEDRLLESGEKTNNLKNMLSQTLKQESPRPVITPKANMIKNESSVVDRLYSYRNKYEQNLTQTKARVVEQHTHKPIINHTSRFVQSRHLRRSASATGLRTDRNPTFTPTLNAKSMKMAERMESPAQRLTRKARPTRIDDSNVCTFEPKINQKSRNLSYSKLQGEDRIKELYDLDFQKRIKLQQTRMKQTAEEDFSEWTFQPQILTKKSAQIQGDVINRLYDWNEKRTLKTQIGQAVKKEADVDNCSFKPNISKPETTEAGIPTLTKGIQEFLDRQRKAREEKEVKESRLTKFTGKTWSNTLTVPVTFNLSQPNSKQTSVIEPEQSELDDTIFENQLQEIHKQLHADI